MNENQDFENKTEQEELDQTIEVIDVEPEEEKLTMGEKLKYFFSEPSKTMKDVAINPVIYPIFIIATLMLILIVPRLNLMIDYMTPQMLESYRQQGLDITELPAAVITISKISMLVAAFVVPIVGWFINGLVILILGLITKCKGRFKGVLSVVGFASIISLMGEAIRATITLITGNPEVYTSLASIGILINPDMLTENAVLFGILSSFEIFNLVSLYFVAIGLTYVYKIGIKKAVILSYATWLLTIIFNVGMGLLF
ncbi:Yip1 family protein [Alkaliphilus peptidifermentans]|uniref:Yip1 domain-containing protein n=1 Tax=Alkaliphilus peptidifermentans DSM 18978 TaxID=1120976 RepID=A0A1G5GG65_9FIRM|nr:Yip1 family protein [Alkaliphilus peptidifermentans]SCY50525.1 Yip1 domain-containing protein [Alkaliphilus peptidifermentans DSM 18978]